MQAENDRNRMDRQADRRTDSQTDRKEAALGTEKVGQPEERHKMERQAEGKQ